jgi:hypothetical protein
MHWKGFGGISHGQIDIPSQHLPGGTKDIHKHLQSAKI